MSIEYSLKRCYGIIIINELVESINDRIYEVAETLGENGDDVCDFFADYYCQIINSWCGGDYFLGSSYSLGGESDLVYEFDNLTRNEKEIEEFKNFCTKYNLWDLFKWEPKDYLINFCY